MRLQGLTAVVTGAASGIGQAIALRFGREGARVVVGDVDAAGGTEVAERIRAEGGRAIAVQADLRDEQRAAALMDEAVAAFGGLHVLVNNAGVTGTTNVMTATDEDWHRIMDINLKGAWYCSKHALPHMIGSGGGSIVNISSMHVTRTQFNHFPYHSAKAGLHTMTLGLAVDFGTKGIRANNICPGFILTPLAERFLQGFPDPEAKERAVRSAHPLGRLGTPDDVAHAAVFLASEESSFISGTSIIVDGGRSAYQKAE